MNSIPKYESENFQLIGYHDLGRNAAFKIALQVVDSRWYLYLTHLWKTGIMVLDVTDAGNPVLLDEIVPAGGPTNTSASNIQVANGLMITSMEQLAPGWAGAWDPDTKEFESGIIIWDVKTDPAHPKELVRWHVNGWGTHRNFYTGDGFVHLCVNTAGYASEYYMILDIRDLNNIKEVGRWFVPEQFVAGGGDPSVSGVPYRYHGLHGPAQVEGNRAYLSYGHSGAIILDVSDYACPSQISRLTFGNALCNPLGVHTYLPIPTRKLAVVSGESIREKSEEPLNYAMLVDIQDETHPRVISILPMPVPGKSAAYQNFQKRGGRCGPHNWHMLQRGREDYDYNDQILFNAYFNAGLRAFDISDPYVPKEAGFFLPEDPKERLGPLPKDLTVSFEDVLIDSRKNIYITDKNYGLFVVRYTGDSK